MGLFDFFSKDKEVVDLSGHEGIAEDAKTDDNQDTEQAETVDVSNSPDQDPNNAEEKKKKLVKRIVDLSDRIEELSSKVYRLQQRVEVLEKKLGSSTGAKDDSEQSMDLEKEME